MEITESKNRITDETKRASAVEVMHYMLQQYSMENNIPFTQALIAFANSSAYETLFDFDTAVWKEGPDYLRALFEQAIEQ